MSNDTIQRLYDRLIFEDRPNVEAIGIDDVAIRKGQTYATAIYDMQDHQLLALLEGRTAATLKEWLVHHKKIQFEPAIAPTPTLKPLLTSFLIGR